MGWKDRWSAWRAPREAGSPAERGGATELAFLDAGLIQDINAWTQPVELYSEYLDPDSPEYNPMFGAGEMPDPEYIERMEAERGWSMPGENSEPDIDWEPGF